MSQSNIRELKADYDKAKRAEQRAQAEMSRCEQLSDNQQSQLDDLLSHRVECVEGLRTAKESGLNIIQIREYQLLLKHLDGVVKEQQDKVDICQVRYEQSRDEWLVKSERLKRLSDMMTDAEKEMREQREREINGGVLKDESNSHNETHVGITGRKLGR